MELNNMRLTPQMIADLYPNVLIESTATSMPEETGIPFLGDNKKNIVILVQEPSAKFITEKELNFLISVLTACKLGLADTAIVNLSGRTYSHTELCEKLSPAVVLMFDVSSSDISLPMEFPYFQVQKFTNQVYVCSPSLREVESDLAMKKQLWTALKKAFAIG